MNIPKSKIQVSNGYYNESYNFIKFYDIPSKSNIAWENYYDALK